jgi:hypothetical protein
VRLLVSMLVALLALALVACGGDGDEASESTDVNQLLEETFAGGKQIDSGKVDLAVRLEAQGGSAPGSATLDLNGPFQSEGDGRLPKFQLNASFDGGGQSLTAGATSTGDQGFVNFQGTDYEVSGPVFQQFKAAYEQAQKQNSQQQGQSLATLGIDPRKWLTNAQNAGEAEVGDTETIKITGDVDVPKLLDDVNAALERLRSLGVQGSEDLPERLTDEQKRQAADAIESLNIEVYTGKDDKILRRLLVALTLKAPEGTDVSGATSANVRLDLQLLDVNEDQEITAPENAKPFEELAQSLGGLGLGGAGSSGSGSGSAGGTSPENLEEFSECVQQAGSDTEKQRECSQLLSP